MQNASPILHEPYPVDRPDPAPARTHTAQDTGANPDSGSGKSPGDDSETPDSESGKASAEASESANESANESAGESESANESADEFLPDAAASEKLQKILQNALQNPRIQLDPQTDSFDIPQNSLDTVFTPSVFPNERIWVLDEAFLSPDGRLGARASDSTVRALPAARFTETREWVFFWVNIRRPAANFSAILPTPATDVRVDQIPGGITLYKNDKDMLFYKSALSAARNIKLRMAAPRNYFLEPRLDPVPVPPARTFPGAERLRALSIPFFGRPDAGFLARMARYFRSFDVMKLRPYSPRTSLEEAILTQKRGVCRHRALLFFGIARAWGYDVRLVLNRVHAFVEIRWDGHPWTRLDLGGAQLPPGFTPPATPDLFSRLSYAYRISSVPPARSGGILSIRVEHVSEPPAFLWAVIFDSGGREAKRIGVFPASLRTETLHIPLPALPAGRYRLILEPPSWRSENPQ